MARKSIVISGAFLLLGYGVDNAKATSLVFDDFSYANNSAIQAEWGSAATLSSGLSFGPLVTSGGSLALSDSQSGYYPTPTAAYRTLGAGAGAFNSSNPSSDPYYQSQLWSSYLIEPTSTVYIANGFGGTGTILGGYYSTTAAPGSDHGELSSNAAYSPTYYGTQQFVGDNHNAGSPAYTVAPNTTYLELGELASNGQDYNYGSPISASEWLFTQAAFSAWVAAGQNQADLNTYAVSEASFSYDATFGFSTLDASSYFNLQALNGSADFGDLRLGTTLADVTPVAATVPEPASVSLLTTGAVLMLSRRRRGFIG